MTVRVFYLSKTASKCTETYHFGDKVFSGEVAFLYIPPISVAPFTEILTELYINNGQKYFNRYLCTESIGSTKFPTLTNTADVHTTRGQSNLTKSASRGAHSPVRGHPRGSKFVPLNSWGWGSY